MGCFICSFSICFIYLAAPRLSSGMRGLRCSVWDPRSLVRGRSPAPCTGSAASAAGAPGESRDVDCSCSSSRHWLDGPGEACRQSLAVLIRWLVAKADGHTQPLTHTVPVLGAAGALLFLRVDCPPPERTPPGTAHSSP